MIEDYMVVISSSFSRYHLRLGGRKRNLTNGLKQNKQKDKSHYSSKQFDTRIGISTETNNRCSSFNNLLILFNYRLQKSS